MFLSKNRPLIIWLAGCCGMIFVMCVIGAITRLTESGLSITEWRPVRGALPPLDDAAWERAFALYRETPQYRAINQGMDLAAFKNIYFWEWIHRLWGRLIGAVYAIPLLFFWLRRKILSEFKVPLLLGLGLGGVQGFLGWFMVQSGLVEGMVSVSPIRLALHLALALFIYSFLFWQILRLAEVSFINSPHSLRLHARAMLALLGLTIIWGAFTAGLDAGKIHTSFPLMNGRLVPEDFWVFDSLLQNITQNPAAAQFVHRWLGVLFFLGILALAARLQKHARGLSSGLFLCASLQLALGILTLLTAAETMLATCHQANAVILLTLLVAANYRLQEQRA